MGQLAINPSIPLLTGQQAVGVYKNLPAAGAVSAGDLVSITETKQFLKASTSFQAETNTTPFFGFTSNFINNSIQYNPYNRRSVVVLDNGLIAVAAPTPNNSGTIYIHIIRPSMTTNNFTVLYTYSFSSIYSGAYSGFITAMPGGRFVYVWYTTGSSAYMVTGNSTGTYSGSQNINIVTLGDQYTSMTGCATSDGIFNLFYLTTTGVFLSRYNNTGNLQNTTTVDTFNTTASTGYYVYCCACANGDWAITYWTSSASRNVARGAGTTIKTNTNNGYYFNSSFNQDPNTTSPELMFQELAGGNFIFLNNNIVYIFNSSFTYILSINPIASYNYVTNPVPLPNGNFAWANAYTSYTANTLRIFSPTGTLLNSTSIAGSGALNSNYVPNYSLTLLNNTYLVLYTNTYYSNVTTRQVLFDLSGNQIGSISTTPNPYSSATSAYTQAVSVGPLIFTAGFNYNQNSMSCYAPARQLAFGVAQNSVSAGGNITVATIGQFNLPSYQNFGSLPQYKDTRLTTGGITGNKIAVIGQSATLTGVI